MCKYVGMCVCFVMGWRVRWPKQLDAEGKGEGDERQSIESARECVYVGVCEQGRNLNR